MCWLSPQFWISTEVKFVVEYWKIYRVNKWVEFQTISFVFTVGTKIAKQKTNGAVNHRRYLISKFQIQKFPREVEKIIPFQFNSFQHCRHSTHVTKWCEPCRVYIRLKLHGNLSESIHFNSCVKVTSYWMVIAPVSASAICRIATNLTRSQCPGDDPIFLCGFFKRGLFTVVAT